MSATHVTRAARSVLRFPAGNTRDDPTQVDSDDLLVIELRHVLAKNVKATASATSCINHSQLRVSNCSAYDVSNAKQ